MEAVMDLLNVLTVLFTKERRHIPRSRAMQSAILDFHSQHSGHSAPGRRMDGMVSCEFGNRNEELRKLRISHSGYSPSRIVNKKRALSVRKNPVITLFVTLIVFGMLCISSEKRKTTKAD